MSTPKTYSIVKWLAAAAACSILVVGIMSFTDTTKKQQQVCEEGAYYAQLDTLPDKERREREVIINSREMEDAMKQVEKALSQVGDELKKMDFSQIGREIDKAFKEVNLEKVMQDVNRTIKQIDFKKIGDEMRRELKNVDLKEMEREIDGAIKELREVDWKEIELELEKAKSDLKEADKEKIKRELENLKPTLEQKMKELKEEMKKLKEEIKKDQENRGYASCCRKKPCETSNTEETTDMENMSVVPML
jgi:hypothetical protein